MNKKKGGAFKTVLKNIGKQNLLNNLFNYEEDYNEIDLIDDFNNEYKDLVNFFSSIKNDPIANQDNDGMLNRYRQNDNLISKLKDILNFYREKITEDILLKFTPTYYESTDKIPFLKKILNSTIILIILKDTNIKYDGIKKYIVDEIFNSFYSTIIANNIIVGDNEDIFIKFFKFYISKIFLNNQVFENNFLAICNLIKTQKGESNDTVKGGARGDVTKKTAAIIGKGIMATPGAIASTATSSSKFLYNTTKNIFYNDYVKLESDLNKLETKISSFSAILNIYDTSFAQQKYNNDMIEIIKKYYNYNNDDILNYLRKYYKNLNENLISTINKYSELYDKIENKELKKRLKKYINKDLYEKSFIYLNNQNDKIDEISKYTKEQKEKYKTTLLKYDKIYNATNGDWKEDTKNNEFFINENPDFLNKILYYKDIYLKFLTLLGGELVIDDKYPDLKIIVENINRLTKKISSGKNITEKDLTDLSDFKLKLKEIQDSKIKGSDPEFDKQIKSTEKLFEKINPENIKQQVSSGKIKVVADNEINFENYVTIFKYALRGLSLIGVVMLFAIVILSLISLFLIIYYIVLNLISLFVNIHTIKSSSLDFIYKNITKCTKENYKEDIFNIFYEQSYSLALFQLGIYAVYLLLIYGLLYVFLIIYSNVMSYKFVGELNQIDESFTVLIMIGVFVIYGFGHFSIYKMIFKTCTFIPYDEINKNEKELDELILTNIIIKNPSLSSTSSLLVDNNFFNALYDSSRMDEINSTFYNEIISGNKETCVKQKIIIYNIYRYLREYIVFDNDMKELFKDYCTSFADNKPKYKNTDTSVTFISMLNNQEVKLIKKYHEELPFYTNIPDDNLEFFNELNLSIGECLKSINVKIVNYKGTLSPFLFTFLYIIIIVFYNIIFFYIIINIMLNDTSDVIFPPVVITAVSTINDNIYKPIIEYVKSLYEK